MGKLLTESNYDAVETNYLVEHFTLYGFSLEYGGSRDVKQTAPNLKLRVGDHIQLWNKVMAEVEKWRYAGPFDKPPFDKFIQSPIGLVPKDKVTKTVAISTIGQDNLSILWDFLKSDRIPSLSISFNEQ